MNAARAFLPRPAGEQCGQADGIAEVEQLMLARMTHVRIDQQGAFTDLREHRGQVRRQPAAAFSPPGTGYRHRLVARIIEPSKRQLASQSPQPRLRLPLWIASRTPRLP